MEEQKIKCPQCGSTQLTAHKKGFSGKKAVAGALLTGGLGILAGTIGSNKIIITCLNCGHRFNTGQERQNTGQKRQARLIWDDVQKKHMANPDYKDDIVTINSLYVFAGIIVLVVLLYFVFR